MQKPVTVGDAICGMRSVQVVDVRCLPQRREAQLNEEQIRLQAPFMPVHSDSASGGCTASQRPSSNRSTRRSHEELGTPATEAEKAKKTQEVSKALTRRRRRGKDVQPPPFVSQRSHTELLEERRLEVALPELELLQLQAAVMLLTQAQPSDPPLSTYFSESESDSARSLADAL